MQDLVVATVLLLNEFVGRRHHEPAGAGTVVRGIGRRHSRGLLLPGARRGRAGHLNPPAAAAGSSAPPKPPVGPRLAVFPIALNDLSNQPASPELAGRMQSLATALRERLATACGYQVVPADSLAQAPAETAPGYLYSHPDIAVGLAASAHAEWIVE